MFYSILAFVLQLLGGCIQDKDGVSNLLDLITNSDSGEILPDFYERLSGNYRMFLYVHFLFSAERCDLNVTL